MDFFKNPVDFVLRIGYINANMSWTKNKILKHCRRLEPIYLNYLYEFNIIRSNMGLPMLEYSIESISSYLNTYKINPGAFLNANILNVIKKEQRLLASRKTRKLKRQKELKDKQNHINLMRSSDKTKIQGKQTAVKAGWVYVITHPMLDGWVKIGSAIDAEKRLQSFQTYLPIDRFVLNKKVYSEDRCSLELKVHAELNYCRGHGEWFQINVKNAIDKIKELS